MTKQGGRAETIAEILEERGPSSSADLLRWLERQGVSPAAARKRLERLPDPIRRLQGFGLPKNQQFFYLPDDWLSPRFREALRLAWDLQRSMYANAMAVLPDDGRPMPTQQFAARAGVARMLKGQVSLDRMLGHLFKLEMLERADVPGLGECVQARKIRGKRGSAQRARAIMLAEKLALGAVRDWLRKMGFISYEAGSVVEDGKWPDFGRFSFDLVAPSYARPLAAPQDGKLKNGFVVADVWLDAELTLAQTAGFVRKTEVIRANARNRSFLAFLIADRFAHDAFTHAKRSGHLFVSLENLLGAEVRDSLKQLIDILTRSSMQDEDGGDIAALFGKLGAIEGAAGNLRGPLFELIVSHAMAATHPGIHEMGVTARDTQGRTADIDVLVRVPKATVACECRGHGPGYEVGVETLKKWRTERVPRMLDWIRQAGGLQRPCSFQYWTTATLSADARKYVEAEQQAVKQYDLKVLDGAAVLKELQTLGLSRLVETLNEHYLRHPLARRRRKRRLNLNDQVAQSPDDAPGHARAGAVSNARAAGAKRIARQPTPEDDVDELSRDGLPF